MEMPETYAEMEAEAASKVTSILSVYPKAERMYDLLVTDDEVRAYWRMTNYFTVRQLGMNDHGETHAKIATASALTILDLLQKAGILPDIVEAGAGSEDDAALVVLSAMLCHDFGNAIHREAHQEISIPLAHAVLSRLLPSIYPNIGERTEILSFILSAIYTHHAEPLPLTKEAAMVCIGDSSDMTKGRGRMAFDAGSITIHTVSALSIERVDIVSGRERPVEIQIMMSNSAGIYQVQEILGRKVAVGPLKDYVDVIALVEPGEGEERILEGITIRSGKCLPFRREDHRRG
ncbi:MAG: Metal dependent phosphohydrolase [Methanomicrobiales archaeon 53_19]|nr:MAG: Metal dependent phosphohydrolase [Methanocalculus sp. 52_23]KUL04084.1 MAG: Metal dependent phosphohydrolase [Methanomicrobiales archaeon 53_19]